MRWATLWASENTTAESTVLKSNGNAPSAPKSTLCNPTTKLTRRLAAPAAIPATAVAFSPGKLAAASLG